MYGENWGLKIISLILAVFIWVQSLLLTEHRSVISMPVVLKNVPKNLTLERLPQNIPFSVRGKGLEIIKLKLSHTKVYIDAAKIKPGHDIISLADYTIDLPENINLTLIGPVEKQDIAVQADVFHQKKVPVVFAFADNYSRSRFSNLNYQVIPEQVIVFGPKRKVLLINQVNTEEITRNMLSEKEFSLKLSEQDNDVSLSEKLVKVRISSSYTTSKVLDGIPITVDPGQTSFPSKATIKISGDSDVLKDFSAQFVKVVIAPVADAQGFYPLNVEVPPSVTVIAVTPNKIRLK